MSRCAASLCDQVSWRAHKVSAARTPTLPEAEAAQRRLPTSRHPSPSSHLLAEVELSARVTPAVECPAVRRCASLSTQPCYLPCLESCRLSPTPERLCLVDEEPRRARTPAHAIIRCLPWYSELSLPLPTELVACTSRPLVTMHHLCPPSHRDEPVQYELSPAPRGVCRAPGSLAAVSAGLVRAPFGRRLVVLSASGICLWSRLCSHRRTIAVHSPCTSHAPSRAALRRTLLAPLLSAGAAGLPA